MIDQPGPRPDAPRRSRATNLEIQKWVVVRHGFVPETAWIEYCKQLLVTAAADAPPVNPCPPEYLPAIRQAFAHFGMLPK